MDELAAELGDVMPAALYTSSGGECSTAAMKLLMIACWSPMAVNELLPPRDEAVRLLFTEGEGSVRPPPLLPPLSNEPK